MGYTQTGAKRVDEPNIRLQRTRCAGPLEVLVVRRREGPGVGAIDRSQLDAWLARLGGPGFQSFDDRDRAGGRDAVLSTLVPLLTDDDTGGTLHGLRGGPARQRGAGRSAGLAAVRDPDDNVRLGACEGLWQYGDDRAVAPLVAALQSDDDPQVRGSAAMGLGRLGGPAVIPALLAAMADDHEEDDQGHPTGVRRWPSMISWALRRRASRSATSTGYPTRSRTSTSSGAWPRSGFGSGRQGRPNIAMHRTPRQGPLIFGVRRRRSGGVAHLSGRRQMTRSPTSGRGGRNLWGHNLWGQVLTLNLERGKGHP